MKKVLIFLGLVLLCLFVGSVSAMSGNGDADNPWIITTPADLQALSGTGLAGYGVNAYYELGADIDMSGVSFTPIGTSSYRFIGSFDGKNHTITGLNLIIQNVGYGLFSWTRGGEIKNIIINNSNLVNDESSTHYYCGLLVGRVDGHTNIQNITLNNCSIISNNNVFTYIALIVGSGNPQISNCMINNCLINISSTGGRCGGYIGESREDTSIFNCSIHNSYIYSGGNWVGGIIGRILYNYATIQSCNVSDCTILIGNNYYVGGIYGYCDSKETLTVTDCTVSDCAIIGTSYVSGEGN